MAERESKRRRIMRRPSAVQTLEVKDPPPPLSPSPPSQRPCHHPGIASSVDSNALNPSTYREMQMSGQSKNHIGAHYGQVVTNNFYNASPGQSAETTEKKRHEIVRWLSPVDFATDQANAAKKHEDRTGEWFTKGERYANWRMEPNSFMWLHGIPGSGKTVLSSEIIKETQAYCARNQDYRLAYFFFSFREETKQKAVNLLSSILAQLILQNSTIPESLQAFHQNHQHGRPPEAGLLTAIKSLLTGPMFIIVDALDECPEIENERKELCQILAKLHGWDDLNLHILVTSRKEQDLSAALGALTTSAPISITEEVEMDIRRYVRSQLAADGDLRDYSTETKTKIQKVLVEKANGMFRWVDCQLDALKRCRDPDKALESLPATLDETYARILQRIDPEWQSEAVAALQWLAYSTRPLRLTELFDAVVIDAKSIPSFSLERRMQQPRRLCHILSSLITMFVDKEPYSQTKGKDIIRLAHFSVKEYLESARILRDQGISTYHLTIESGNRVLAESSLLYINSYAASNIKTRTKQDSKLFPLLEYTCLKWGHHAQAAKEATKPQLDDLIFKFLSSDADRKAWSFVFDHTRDGYCTYREKEGGALYYAASLGLCSVAKLIIDTGVDVDAHPGYLGTALQGAGRFGDLDIIQRLLEAGADVNTQAGHYGTALQAACENGNIAIVQRLLEAGADVNAQAGDYSTALQVACGNGNIAIVQRLLEAGADVNAQAGNHGTALQAACGNGNIEIVQRLLEAGADVNAQAGHYGSALILACYQKNLNIVQRLLQAGADVNLLDLTHRKRLESLLGGERVFQDWATDLQELGSDPEEWEREPEELESDSPPFESITEAFE